MSITPFEVYTREQWSALAASAHLPLTADDVARLRSLGDPIDLEEVDAVYRPLAALLQVYRESAMSLRARRNSFLRRGTSPTPYVIGIAGSVAVGKSSTARLLRELIRRYPQSPNVSLVTTDGFLYPNAELERRGLMARKGFPESFDRRALLRFVRDVKAGKSHVRAPIYSHLTYDVVEGEYIEVNKPDVLIVEGLNVLAPPPASERRTLVVSDFFDFSIYVHSKTSNLKSWYIDRFLKLRKTAFTDPASYFKKYAHLSDEEATETAARIWDTINAPNLVQNIAPTRGRATLVLTKGSNHEMRSVSLRKI